jgi:hypothetical protein
MDEKNVATRERGYWKSKKCGTRDVIAMVLSVDIQESGSALEIHPGFSCSFVRRLMQAQVSSTTS